MNFAIVDLFELLRWSMRKLVGQLDLTDAPLLSAEDGKGCESISEKELSARD